MLLPPHGDCMSSCLWSALGSLSEKERKKKRSQVQAYLIRPVTDGGKAVQTKLPASCGCLPSAAQEPGGMSLPPRWALMARQPWPQRSSLERQWAKHRFQHLLDKNAHQLPADRKQGEHGQLGLTKDCQPHSVLAALFLRPSLGLGCFLTPKMLTQSQV